MFVYVLFLCLLPQLYGSPYPSTSIETLSHEYSDIGQRRESRSVFTKLPTSILLLLQTAKKVPSRNVKIQKFEKTGGAYQAERDYLALNPVFPNRQRFAFKGVVDDVFVRFRQSDSSMGRMPTLQISDKNGEIGSIKIVYQDLIGPMPMKSPK